MLSNEKAGHHNRIFGRFVFGHGRKKRGGTIEHASGRHGWSRCQTNARTATTGWRCHRHLNKVAKKNSSEPRITTQECRPEVRRISTSPPITNPTLLLLIVAYPNLSPAHVKDVQTTNSVLFPRAKPNET